MKSRRYYYYYDEDAGAPAISVYGNSVLIANGDSSPSAGDHTNYGDVLVGAKLTRTFTIKNADSSDVPGTADLEGLVVAAPDGYVVVTPPTSPVAPGASTTFQVRCETAADQVYAGNISITGDDGISYSFAVTCNSDLPVIAVTPSTWNYDSTPVGTPVSKIFTILNSGLVTMTITLPITSDHIGYTITVPPPVTSLAPGASTTFTVEFDAAFNASGYAGNISIVSNATSSPTVIVLSARIWAFYASGASNTAEIGTATRVQTDGTIASNGTKFAFTAQASPVWGDLSLASQLITMLDNVAMVMVGVLNESTKQAALIGWSPLSAITDSMRLSAYSDGTVITTIANGAVVASTNTYSANTDYPIAVIARDTDSDANAEEYHVFVRIAGVWKRLWVLRNQNDASMYVGFGNRSAVGTLEKFKVEPLAASLFNPPVSFAGAISAGQTWTAPNANFFLQKVLTTRPSAGSEIMKFRVQDASNYLVNSIANTTGIQTLEKVVAGVATAIGSGGAATNGAVCKYVANGTNVQAFVAATQSYSVTVTEFATSTGGELNSLGTGGAVSDIEIWLLNEAGAVHTALEATLNG
jgi:hypothetical protein